MAERIAQRHPLHANGFHIPVDTEKLTDFPHQKNVAVLLNDSHAGYEVYQKDIPSHLAGRSHKNKPVKWLNNFGLKQKNSVEFPVEVPEYSILLDHIEGAEFVYFDGSEIRPLATKRHEKDPSKTHATLRLGDPPIGWVKISN